MKIEPPILLPSQSSKLIHLSIGTNISQEIKESLFIKENGRKIKKYIVASVPVVAAYGMLAYRLAFHTGSEVTFNPTFFFYFSVSWLQ